MADIAPGSADWWKYMAQEGLDVKMVIGDAPKSTDASRKDARKAGMRDEDTKKVGWNATKLPGMKGKMCYWHTSDLTRCTWQKMNLLAKLGRAAPKKKVKKRGFTPTKKVQQDATEKKAKTGKHAPNFYQLPHVVEAQRNARNRQTCRKAAAGHQIGTSNSAKSKVFNDCAFLGELFVLMYIGLLNPHIRPLICVCELWWLLDRYGIECEFERWYGWMEDMWWCTNGSAAGSGGIAGRLVTLELGTTTDFTNSWPKVERPADMERVAQLLDVSKESLRDVGPFHKTFLAREPGNLVYQINHACRPAWHSRTSCWHRLVGTLRNLRRPEGQIFPGRDEAYYKAASVRRLKPAPDGSEWFAGAGQWCLGPVMRRAALLKIDGSALAPAGFTGPQRTIVIMSLASLYEGRPMFVRHGAESRAPSVWSGPDDRRRTRAVATVPALTTSSTQVEVKWHRPDFVGERAEIVLAYGLVRLANEHPQYKYAVPEGNALKVAASLRAASSSGRARGMWIVVSEYLREKGWLDARVKGRTRSAEPYKTWGMRRADGGVEQLTWRPAPAGHGRAHGVSDAAAERGVQVAAAYEDFVGNRVAFIKAARDIKNTHLALTDAESAAPMACFENAHADVLKMRAPPHVTDPTYKIEVGAGLVVFTLAGLYGCEDDAEVLRKAGADYLQERKKLIDRCWRHHTGNLHRLSDEYAAAVAAAVAAGRRNDDVALLGALADVVEAEEAVEDAAEEDDVEGAEEEIIEEPGADDEVVDYLDDAASPTDLKPGARVDGNWDDTGVWYPATVRRVLRGGACDVDYDDATNERSVPPARLRPRAAPDTKSFAQGDFVMANLEGRGDYYRALLKTPNCDGFDVIYPDLEGELEISVPVSRMRPVRETDKMELDDGPDYSDLSTEVTVAGLEGMSWRDLTAACRCRGLLKGLRPYRKRGYGKRGSSLPDKKECKELLKEYLEGDAL